MLTHGFSRRLVFSLRPGRLARQAALSPPALLASVFCLGLLLAGCGKPTAEPERPNSAPNVPPDLALATYADGETVTAAWYLDRKKVLSPGRLPPPDPEKETEFLTGDITRMLLDHLLAEQARAAGMADDATHTAWQEGRRAALALSLSRLRFLREAVGRISEDDLKRHYEAHKEEYFRPAKYYWKKLGISKETRGREAALERILQAKAMLDAGRPFDEVNELFSDEPPEIRRKPFSVSEGELPQIKVEQTLAETPVDRHSEILDLVTEFQILFVTRKIAAHYQPLEEVSYAIRDRLIRERKAKARAALFQAMIDKGHLRLHAENARMPDLAPGVELARLDDPSVDGDEMLFTVADLNEWTTREGIVDLAQREEYLLDRVLDQVLKRQPDYKETMHSAELEYLLSIMTEPILGQRISSAVAEERMVWSVTEEEMREEHRLYPNRYADPERRAVYALWCNARMQQDMYQYMQIQALSEAKARAMRIYAELANGESFLQAVRRESDGSRENDGLVGILKRGDLDHRLENEAFRLALCEVSEPLGTKSGFVILWVPAIRPKRYLSLEEAEPVVRANLLGLRRTETRKAWELEQLRTLGEVVVDVEAAHRVTKELYYRRLFDPSGEQWPVLDLAERR